MLDTYNIASGSKLIEIQACTFKPSKSRKRTSRKKYQEVLRQESRIAYKTLVSDKVGLVSH